MRIPKTRFFLALMALSMAWVLGSAQTRAQSTTWIGGEIGDPSGLVLRPDYVGRTALEFHAAWDLDDFFFLNVHRMMETPIENGRPLYFMFGPGLFVGVEERAGDEEVIFGISGKFGIGYGGMGYRIYGAVTPRLSLIPDTDGQVGGAVGVLFRL